MSFRVLVPIDCLRGCVLVVSWPRLVPTRIAAVPCWSVVAGSYVEYGPVYELICALCDVVEMRNMGIYLAQVWLWSTVLVQIPASVLA